MASILKDSLFNPLSIQNSGFSGEEQKTLHAWEWNQTQEWDNPNVIHDGQLTIDEIFAFRKKAPQTNPNQHLRSLFGKIDRYLLAQANLAQDKGLLAEAGFLSDFTSLEWGAYSLKVSDAFNADLVLTGFEGPRQSSLHFLKEDDTIEESHFTPFPRLQRVYRLLAAGSAERARTLADLGETDFNHDFFSELPKAPPKLTAFFLEQALVRQPEDNEKALEAAQSVFIKAVHHLTSQPQSARLLAEMSAWFSNVAFSGMLTAHLKERQSELPSGLYEAYLQAFKETAPYRFHKVQALAENLCVLPFEWDHLSPETAQTLFAESRCPGPSLETIEATDDGQSGLPSLEEAKRQVMAAYYGHALEYAAIPENSSVSAQIALLLQTDSMLEDASGAELAFFEECRQAAGQGSYPPNLHRRSKELLKAMGLRAMRVERLVQLMDAWAGEEYAKKGESFFQTQDDYPEDMQFQDYLLQYSEAAALLQKADGGMAGEDPQSRIDRFAADIVQHKRAEGLAIDYPQSRDQSLAAGIVPRPFFPNTYKSEEMAGFIPVMKEHAIATGNIGPVPWVPLYHFISQFKAGAPDEERNTDGFAKWIWRAGITGEALFSVSMLTGEKAADSDGTIKFEDSVPKFQAVILNGQVTEQAIRPVQDEILALNEQGYQVRTSVRDSSFVLTGQMQDVKPDAKLTGFLGGLLAQPFVRQEYNLEGRRKQSLQMDKAGIMTGTRGSLGGHYAKATFYFNAAPMLQALRQALNVAPDAESTLPSLFPEGDSVPFEAHYELRIELPDGTVQRTEDRLITGFQGDEAVRFSDYMTFLQDVLNGVSLP